MIEGEVVQPVRGFRPIGEGYRRVRKRHQNVEFGEVVAPHDLVEIELGPGGVAVGGRSGAEIREDALLVRDGVAGVVRHDVHDHLEAGVMGGVDERLELAVRAEMRVDAGVVDLPVPVVAGGGVLDGSRPLYGAVEEWWRDPDRGCAQAGDVVEAARQAGEVAAVEVTAMLREEAVCERTVSEGVEGS